MSFYFDSLPEGIQAAFREDAGKVGVTIHPTTETDFRVPWSTVEPMIVQNAIITGEVLCTVSRLGQVLGHVTKSTSVPRLGDSGPPDVRLHVSVNPELKEQVLRK
ncbi:MAG: hypothetical protein AAB524_02195 [Patescibacteria group bacterium]